ncbi:hypothetical protein N1F78_08055 [Seonamhaeicola sp. MEBiC1930]|uniref:hypothetical protein n=1 Tax=Seonamhaeicola sp. MEBiC01930 TaxID=2976768 RepID=UPI003244F874
MKKILSLTFLLSLLFVACDNEGAQDNLNETITLSAASEAAIEETEVVLDDIALYSESVYGVSTSKSSSTITSKSGDKYGRSRFFKNCADIVVEVTDSLATVTITFNGECEDSDGNVITGTITKVREIGDATKTKTVTFTDVSVNGYLVNGTKQYTFVEENSNGNPQMDGTTNITVETDEGTYTKVGNRTVEITAGGDTDTCYDDEKTITGASTYTDAAGNTYSMEITTALVKPAECRYIASGIKTYTTPEGTSTLDYGDGTCDNVAIKTATDGTVTEVELRKKRKK